MVQKQPCKKEIYFLPMLKVFDLEIDLLKIMNVSVVLGRSSLNDTIPHQFLLLGFSLKYVESASKCEVFGRYFEMFLS